MFKKIYKKENKINSSDKGKDKDISNIFNDINSLKQFLKEECKEFDEKYELLEKINSECGSGAVYRGKLRKKNNPTPIAFKFLRSKKKINEKNQKDFNKHNEISNHEILKCKHIPALDRYYKIQNSSCIVMEYNQYGDLRNFQRNILKRNYLSETLISYIAGELLEALYYIHIKNKIIHMDIKPQNALIDDYLNIKLADFSTSINYKTLNCINLPLVGTNYYMSPEVLNKRKIISSEASKTDIYSLGVLLYNLAFGDYPYKVGEVDSKDFAQIAKNIKELNLVFPGNNRLSKAFLDFLKKCLNKDIKQRYDISQAMNDAWFKGYQIILDEKEKLDNVDKFLIDLMNDNLIQFNKYIKTLE